MAGPYDYTVNIPQPPAQNFLQSLLGIQQLKGLQQQSQLAEQQAAIQQQNAAFQQQMQPLQIEAERARINQIGQATAASAETLKGARLQNEQLQRQSDFQKELVKFTSKPVEQWSESEVRSIAARGAAINPKATEGVINFWASQPKPEKTLVDDAAMKAGIAIAQNRPDVAKSIVDQAKLDAEKLGFTTALNFLNFGGSQLDQDPALAYATILGHFGTDKTKLDQLVTASELKGKLEETQAKTKKEQAEAEDKTWQGALTKWKAQNAMTGELDPEEVVKRENSLRENFLSQLPVRRYQGRIENYDIVKNAERNTPGDVAKMTAFIKLGDPDSTVSMAESGQLVASNIGEQAAKLVEQFNLNGGKLSDDMRKKIDAQADATMRSAKKSFESGVLAGFIRTAKAQKLNPENVTGFLSPVSVPEKDQGPTSEEQRIRAMLRPAAGFGNTMTPSQIQPQGGTFQGRPTDVDAILKQLGVQ